MKQTVFSENRYYEELEKGSQSSSENISYKSTVKAAYYDAYLRFSLDSDLQCP